MKALDIDSLPKSGTLLGRALRAPLRLIPKRTVVRILRGPLRGTRWIVGSGIHRIWLGGFEPAKMALAVTLTNRDGVAIDIGANVGVYTLLFSSAVGAGGRVIAIEPNPENLAFIQRHIELNAIKNVTVIAAAAGDRSGSVAFDCGETSSTGRIDTNGGLVVRCVTVDEVMDQAGGRASVVKIDVEGGELDVLKGARATLQKHRPVVLLATHSRALRGDCARFLESLEYEMHLIDGSSDPDEWLAEPATRSGEARVTERNAMYRAIWSGMAGLKNLLVSDAPKYRRILFGPAKGAVIYKSLRSGTRQILGVYEREVTPYLRRYVKSADCCYDIGSADGYYAFACARLARPGEVFCFDIDENAVGRLRDLVARNSHLGSRVNPNWIRLGAAPVSENHTSLDALINERGWKPPDVIKLDVEGDEFEILNGAVRVLREHHPRLIIEVHSLDLEQACDRLLRDLGYRTTIVNNSPALAERAFRPIAHNQWLCAE